MPPLRGLGGLGNAPSASSRMVMNGRPASGANALRGGSPGQGRPNSAEGVDILAVLKQAARQEPAAALRELQRLHSQLTGAAGKNALGSLESAWQQQASDGPGGSGGLEGASAAPSRGGGPGAGATANAITAQQRELNQLTIQRQRLQQQQREQRNELHSVTSELDKRKNELRQVTDQLKARRNMLKGSGSPRPPSPPRGSPGGGQSPGSDVSTAGATVGGSVSSSASVSKPKAASSSLPPSRPTSFCSA